MKATFDEQEAIKESPATDKKEQLGRFLNISLLVFIGVHIFFNPFPQLTAIEEISFYGGVLLLSALLMLKKATFTFKTPLTTLFLIFVIWTVVGLFFAIDKTNTLHDIYAHLLKYLLVFFLLVNYFNSFRRFEVIWLVLIFSTSVFAVYIIIYFYILLGNPFAIKLGYNMPWEIPPNFICVLTVFALLLSINIYNFRGMKAYKILMALPAGLLLLTTLLTKTRSAIVALFAALIVLFMKNKKTLLIFLISFFLAISLMPVKERFSPELISSKLQNDDRIQIWYTFWEIIRDHPVTGIGFGMETYHDDNLLNKYNERVPPAYRQSVPVKSPHNFFVDITVRTGFVGLAIFILIIRRFFMMAFEIIISGRSEFVRTWAVGLVAAMISWLLLSMFESIVSGPAAKIFFIIAAMMTILWNLREEEKPVAGGLI